MSYRTKAMASCAAVAACVGAAWGQDWSDNFDAYPLGVICGQGGWEEWSSSSGLDVCGSVSNEQALSDGQSLKIVGTPGGAFGLGDDTVQQFEVAGGVWTFSIMTYVPSDATGAASIILLNTYPATVNQNWSLVIELDADTGLVEDWIAIPLTTLVQGEWVEFRVEVDLDNDSADYFYDGVEILSDATWADKIQAGGTPTIQALDLYGGEPPLGTTGTYFDDASLTEAGADCYADCNDDTVVNIFDFLCFQGLVTNGDPAADCNGDGPVNIFDFLCFQGAVTEGCG